MTNREPTKKRNPWDRRFALAALVYVIGIVAFSAWSYLGEPAVAEAAESGGPQISTIALMEGTEFAFLALMSIPLMVLYHRARAHSQHEEQKLDAQLQRDNEKLKAHEKELEDAILDLQRFNEVATGRELRILELKNEVNSLLEEMNRPKRYTTATTHEEQSDRNDG